MRACLISLKDRFYAVDRLSETLSNPKFETLIYQNTKFLRTCSSFRKDPPALYVWTSNVAFVLLLLFPLLLLLVPRLPYVYI